MSDYEQEKRIRLLEEQIAELRSNQEKIKNDIIPLTKKVVTWHVHGSNGKIYWELPLEIRKEQEKILKKVMGSNNKSVTFKSSIPRADDEVKITIIEEN